MTSPAPPDAPDAPRRAGAAPLAAVVLLGAALGCTQIASLDLPLALANGARVLGGEAVPRTNAWLWTFPGYPCVHDKWGFDLLVAAAWKLAGTGGLEALQMTFGAAMGALLFALCRRVATPWRAAGLAALGLTMVSYRLFLRAEWISYLGAGTTLLLLPAIVARRRVAEALFLLTIPVWAACHLYWFLGPLIVLAAAVAGRSARTALVAAGGVLAAAASPFGVDNVLHPVRITLQLGGTELGTGLVENRFPFGAGSPWTFFHVLAAALVAWGVAAAAVSARRGDVRSAVLAAAWLALACPIDRNIALLGIAVPLFAAAPLPPRVARGAAWAGLAGPVVAIAVGLGAPWFLAGRVPGFGWEDDLFPRRLCEDLADRREERYVNDFSIGSFLDFARGRSFIDGNTHGYPRDFYALYRSSLEGAVGTDEIDARFPNDGWLLRHNRNTTRMWILGLFLRDDYAPVAWDHVATLFRRSPSPEDADAAWRRWLGDEYLAFARPWFASDDDAAAAARGPGGARAAAALAPWSPRWYLAMARDSERAGDGVLAGRCLRWASRFPK